MKGIVPFCFLNDALHQDIEFTVQDSSPLVRPGCVAAFSETELGGNIEVRAMIGKPGFEAGWAMVGDILVVVSV